jgi:hypothetical protein
VAPIRDREADVPRLEAGVEQDLGATIARDANARNNAVFQDLRMERWRDVRDSLWQLVDPLLSEGANVALIGAGSCDDVPLARITERAARVDLVDFDPSSTVRALARIPATLRDRLTVIEEDVTGGSADLVLQAVRDDTALPDALPLPYHALGSGEYDLVVGDMLYTQLLHAGLIALEVFGDHQLELMHRYDPALTTALVQRIEASLAPGGHAIHVHDVACWAEGHEQPLTLDEVLEDPFWNWTKLRRHDDCDPHLVLGRIRAHVLDSAWWAWPFEPRKQFLVRATVTRASPGAASPLGTILR